MKLEIYILLIENDLNQVYYFQGIFHNSNQATFRVSHQPTIEAGLYYLGHERVDAILFDLPISNESQLDLVYNLYILAPTIPIIVLGDVLDDSFGLEVIKAGAQDYLRKEGLSSKELIRTILCSIERMRLVLSKPNDPLGSIPSTTHSSSFTSQMASALEEAQRPDPVKEADFPTQDKDTLSKSDARFYQFISSLSAHVYVTKISPTGDFENLYLSPNIETLTGYSQQKFWDDWSFWPTQVIHPADRNMAKLQADYLASGVNHEAEYRLIRADGQVIWVRDSGRVDVEDENRIIYGVVSDITERKRAELEKDWLTEELRSVNQSLDQRVRDRTTELQAILDAVGEGVAVTDLEGIVQYINPAMVQMTGYDKAEAIEQLATLWENNEQNKTLYTKMWQTVLLGQTWRGELKQARKDNTLYDTLMTVTPIWGLDKKPQGFVSVQSDITPLKEMDRIKSSFLSTAAHELRTPLTSIQGFSEILLTRDLKVEQQHRYLTFINQQSNALADIINDLLDLARLEGGHGFEMEMKVIDLGAIVDEILFGFQENNPQHSYQINMLEAWPPLIGDQGKMAQLLKNLFSNATKYSPGGGQIILSAQIEAEYGLLHITLSDEGIGMTEAQLSHVFDRFYRVDYSNTAIGGTGLGMAISQLIVKQHKGKIWLESELGSGTTVHLLFPLQDRPSYVLVIEDDLELVRLERAILEHDGFMVLAALEGYTGLELARRCAPDLIVLDLNLPGLSGFSILEELQADILTQNIPVLITSALDNPEHIKHAIDIGATDYLVKPYNIGDLILRANRAISQAVTPPYPQQWPG